MTTTPSFPTARMQTIENKSWLLSRVDKYIFSLALETRHSYSHTWLCQKGSYGCCSGLWKKNSITSVPPNNFVWLIITFLILKYYNYNIIKLHTLLTFFGSVANRIRAFDWNKIVNGSTLNISNRFNVMF